MLQAFLTRSGNAPLNIKATQSDDDVLSKFLPLIMPQVHRAFALELYLKPRPLSFVASRFPTSIPRLQSLSIEEASNWEHPNNGVNRMLPSAIVYWLRAPLRYLSCQDLIITQWSKGLLPTSLTSLDIHFPEGTSIPKPPVSDVIDVLRDLSALTTLFLYEVLAPSPLHGLSDGAWDAISLPHIQDLRFSASYRACICFRDHVKVPSSASIRMLFQDRIRRPEDIPYITAHIRSQLVFNGTAHDADWVEFDGIDSDDAFVRFIRREHSGCLEITQARNSRDINCLAGDICPQLPIQGFSWLSIRVCDSMEASAYQKLLHAMPNLDTLDIEYSDWPLALVADIFQYRAIDVVTSTEPPHIPMPKLRRLQLHNLRFKSSRSEDDSDDWEEETHATYIDDVCAVLTLRKEAGHAVEELSLRSCTGAEAADADRLAALLTKFEWDERKP